MADKLQIPAKTEASENVKKVFARLKEESAEKTGTAPVDPTPVTEESFQSLQEAIGRTEKAPGKLSVGPPTDPREQEQRKGLLSEIAERRNKDKDVIPIPTSPAVPQPNTQPVPGTLTAEQAQTRQLQQVRDGPPSIGGVIVDSLDAIVGAIVTDLITDPVRGMLPEGFGGFSEEDKRAYQGRVHDRVKELYQRQEQGGPLALLDAIGIGVAPAAGLPGIVSGIGSLKVDAQIAARVLQGARKEVPVALRRLITEERGALTLPGGKRPGPPEGLPAEGALSSGRVPGSLARAKTQPPRDPYEMTIKALEPEPESIISQLKEAIPQQLYDRNFPLKGISEASGIPVRKLAQIVPGALGAAEDILNRVFKPIMSTVNKDRKFLERYMTLMRDGDILTRNPHAKLPGGVSGQGEVLQAISALEKQVGPARMATIRNAAENLWQSIDEHVLQVRRSEGIISPKQYTAMKSTHPHYIPFTRDDFADIAGSSLTTRQEANLAATGIKEMDFFGSERALSQPLNRLFQEVAKAQTAVWKNRAAKSIVRALEEVQRQTGDDMVRYIEPAREMRTVERVTGAIIPRAPKGEISKTREIISFFDAGVKNTVEVPAIFGRVAKGLEGEPQIMALQVMRWLNAPLRSGATTFYSAFLPVNVGRDVLSAAFREKLFPFGPDYWAGMWAAIRKNRDFQDAAQAGVLLSGIVDDMTKTRISTRPLGGINLKNPLVAASVPFRLIEGANIIAERGIRIAVFRKLKAEGLDTLEAAIRSRDSTVDFAKMGHAMRTINTILPFTNAGTQGLANFLRTIRDHPVRSAAFGAMFSAASFGVRINNMRFETSDLIPDWEYTRNWSVQFAEGTRKDGTKFPIYINIPKGEIAAMFTFPAEAIMHMARRSEDRGIVELMLDQGIQALRTVSPIEASITGVIPPLFETGIGATFGFDPFTGQPLIPRGMENMPVEQQFDQDTSNTAIALGRMFKVSPFKIDFALKRVAAGTGAQVNWLLSGALDALGYDPTPFGVDRPDQEARDNPEGVEALSKIPGLGRFLRTNDSQVVRRGWDLYFSAVESTNREFSTIEIPYKLGIRLGDAGNSIRGIELEPRERALYQEKLGEIVTPAMREYVAANPNRSRDTYLQVRDNWRDKARAIVLREILAQRSEEDRDPASPTPEISQDDKISDFAQGIRSRQPTPIPAQ